MSSRRNIPTAYEERFRQNPRTTRHGTHHPREPPPPNLLETKLAEQSEEIERLVADNHTLAATDVALKRELVAAVQEVEKLREHIRSIQTESDIQIRILLEKNAKMEADIRARDNIKKDLQQAHLEARSLVTSRQELTAEIEQAAVELEKVGDDVKKLRELRAELDKLRQEHQSLRKTFQAEKSQNVEKVEQMKRMEMDLIGMAEKVERLRADVLNAQKRAQVPVTAASSTGAVPSPYGGPYINPAPPYPPPVHVNNGYGDSYRPYSQVGNGPVGESTMVPYCYGNAVAPPAPVGGTVLTGDSGVTNHVLEGSYDASQAQR